MPLLFPRGPTVILWAIALASVAATVPWRLLPVVATIGGAGVVASILTRRIPTPGVGDGS